jgi:uncharacterized membrane protein YhfC
MPLFLGWFIARRRHVSWRFFGIGAATFVLSQMGHIPFNYLVINNWLADPASVPQGAYMVVLAVFLGLSAALFEEGARYLSFRFWAMDARTWGSGVMMGAGHGGAESILLGILGALNATILVGYQAGYFQRLIPAEQAPLVVAAVDQIMTMPWFEMLLGALERAFVICIQLALSLMVMQVFTRSRVRWLAFAFGWHALVDAGVVLAVEYGGVYIAELLTGIAAVISLAIVYWLQAPEPQRTQPKPLDEPGRVPLIHIETTKEKMEDSRYL